jgi:hypothetical protein
VPVDGRADPAQADDMTGDQFPPISRFELATRELHTLGIVMMRLPGEYRVNYRSGTTRSGARETRPTTAPHDAEGDATPHDPLAHTEDACVRAIRREREEK